MSRTLRAFPQKYPNPFPLQVGQALEAESPSVDWADQITSLEFPPLPAHRGWGDLVLCLAFSH